MRFELTADELEQLAAGTIPARVQEAADEYGKDRQPTLWAKAELLWTPTDKARWTGPDGLTKYPTTAEGMIQAVNDALAEWQPCGDDVNWWIMRELVDSWGLDVTCTWGANDPKEAQ